MLDFFKFYLGCEVGFWLGKKLPGMVRGFLKGVLLILSTVFWFTASGNNGIFEWYAGAGIKVLNILYCMIVWIGIACVIVAKIHLKKDMSQLYYWVVFALSILVGIVNVGGESFGYRLLGVLFGYFLVHFPVFVNALVGSVVDKIRK